MKLEVLRRQRLLSQAELAEKAGVAKSTIYLIEAGKTTPRYGIMRRLCEALGVQASEVDEFRWVIEDQNS